MKKLLCILLSVLLLLASCGGNDTTTTDTSSEITVDTVKVEDIASYVIVMPKKALRGERNAALELKDVVEDKLGITLKISNDSKESVGNEILVGKTTRPGSSDELKYSDYIIKRDGDNIVINAGGNAALMKAVDFVSKNLITDCFNFPKEPVTYTGTYSFENATVGGVKLSAFAAGSTDSDEVIAINNALGALTGMLPPEESANKVVLKTDNTLEGDEAKVTFDGTNIVIYSNGSGITKVDSASALFDAVVAQTGTELTLNTVVNVIPADANVVTEEQIAEWREMTDQRIEEIKNTPNMEIPKGATVYYISNKGSDSNDGKTPATAWATIDRLANATLKEGDYVLFERGGYFRGNFGSKAGVTYSAYGTGEKPIICGSPEDGANPSKWTKVANNIWEYQTAFEKDIGSMVFNHGEAYAVKWLVYTGSSGTLQEYKTKTLWNGVTTIKKDLEFWHSTENNKIYLYSEKNPGERFSSIEFLQKVNAIGCGGNNVTFDNLTIKYTGAHGIGGGTKSNLTIKNCTFEWIGGSVHHVNHNGTYPTPVRYGNAIEIYGGCDGFVVENCYFNQIYDAAITHQYNFSDDPGSMTDRGHYNVLYKNNVLEYCVYPIEYFLGNIPEGNPSHYDNIVYEGNIMWHTGEGLGSQRPDETQPAAIKGWTHNNPTKNFVIKDNLAIYSTQMFVHTNFKNLLDTTGIELSNNTFVGTYGQRFGAYGYNVGNKEVNFTDELDTYLGKYAKTGNNYYYVK